MVRYSYPQPVDKVPFCAEQHGAVVGFQFHPGRSGPDGLDLLAQIYGELLR